MKPQLLLITLAVLINASSYNEDRFPTDVSVRRLSTISSSFTDIAGYNTWDHARIPLGVFETHEAMTTLNLGYRRLRWMDVNNFDSTQIYNGIIAPTIRVGAQGKVYCDLNYSFNPISITDEEETPSMPLNRFGLTIMGQVEDGRFQIGMTGMGYMGKEGWDENGNKRVLMGGDNVGLFLGFKLHEVVLLNIFGHSAGYIDTLYLGKVNDVQLEYPQERLSWFQLPEINVAMDIGKKGMPYACNMSITYSHNNFVYTGKKDPFTPMFDPYYDYPNMNNDNALSGYNDGGDIDPIVSDSIAWHMQHLWNIEVNDILRFDPAAQLGYWHTRYKHMEPNGDNYPINYDGERPGWEWDTKSFRFGIGGSWLMKEITKIWLEYSYASLKLDITGDKLSDYEVPRSKGYSRVGVGFTTNFDKIPQLGMSDAYGFYLTFGFLFMQDNELASPYCSKPFRRMYPIYDNTQQDILSDINVELNRYQPWEAIKNQLNTMHIAIGLGATFLDNAFETALHFGIINQRYTAGRNEEYKGFEFGFDLIYNKFGNTKSSAPKQVDKVKEIENTDQNEESEDTDYQDDMNFE